MPDRKLPDWIEGFQLYMKNTEPPESFILWTAISVVAAALQRKCLLKWGTITFYPNLYILLVGPSASRKGTAMGPGTQLLEDANIPLAADSTTREALIRRLKQSRNDPVVDTDTGKVEAHSSMTIFSEEFTVFLGYHNNEMMSALCNWYDCKKVWRYETISRDVEKIHGVWVNLMGATTPELIKSSMPLDAIGGGLTTRIIGVFESEKGKDVIIPFQTPEEIELYQYLLWDLEKISLFKGEYHYTEGFIDRWTEWYTNASGSDPIFSDPRFAGYIGRRPSHILKLSMVMSASRRPEKENLIITKEDIDRAIMILEKTELKMPRIFSGVGKSDISGLIPEVMAYLSVHKKASKAQILRAFISDADDFVIDRVIRTLESMDYIQVVHGKEITINYKGP